MNKSDDYLVDEIFPRREVHLIGGPSGAGKTTLLFHMLEDWQAPRPVFGFESYPLPFAYVACDRSMASTDRTLARSRTTLKFPRMSVNGLPRVDGAVNLDRLVEGLLEKVGGIGLVVLDAIGSLCPEGRINDYAVVADFLIRLTSLCQKHNLTIIGLGHSTKVREGEEFSNPRQRFLGSVAWAGFSDTMIFVEPDDPKCPEDPHRNVLLLPRNSPGQTFRYKFSDEGRLERVEETPHKQAEAKSNFVALILGLPVDTSYSLRLLLDMARDCGIAARRSAERIVTELTDSGQLLRVGKGRYQRPGSHLDGPLPLN